MAEFKFNKLADGAGIKLGGGNTLVFGGAISAADVSVAELKGGVELSVGDKSVLLKGYTLGNLSLAEISFDNGSELLVGDTLVAPDDDNDDNAILPTLIGAKNRDKLLGLGGDDQMGGDDGADILFGGAGNDTMDGDAGDDRLDGGRGDDQLNGSRGNDVLKGFAGADVLIGGMGADLMDGGDDADIYRIEAADSAPVANGYDHVMEFVTGSDQFDLAREGTADNYVEKNLKTNDFATALQEAINQLVQYDGLKDYVFISGKSKGWLFGELTDDLVPDLAVEIGNGRSLDALTHSDIV